MTTKNPLGATVLAAIVFAVTIAATTSSAEARRKPPVDPDAVVTKFLADLDDELDDLDDYEDDDDDLFDDIVDDLDDAVEDGKLRKVLALEGRLDKVVTREFRSYEIYLNKSESKVLRTLDKADADPSYAAEIQSAVAAARADLQLRSTQLRALIAEAIDDAIAQIEADLDDDDDDDDDDDSNDD